LYWREDIKVGRREGLVRKRKTGRKGRKVRE